MVEDIVCCTSSFTLLSLNRDRGCSTDAVVQVIVSINFISICPFGQVEFSLLTFAYCLTKYLFRIIFAGTNYCDAIHTLRPKAYDNLEIFHCVFL